MDFFVGGSPCCLLYQTSAWVFLSATYVMWLPYRASADDIIYIDDNYRLTTPEISKYKTQVLYYCLPFPLYHTPTTSNTMRPVLVAALLPLIVTAYALSPVPKARSVRASPPSPQADDDNFLLLLHAQRPLNFPATPGPAMPPSSDPSAPPGDPPAGGPGTVILSDVMGRDRSINIFAGLVRDVESASRRLDDAARNSTVLAPLNSAMEKMPRKPWEDPRDYDTLGTDAYEGDEGWERAQRNIRRFVEAHVVPTNPWREGEKIKAMGGEGDIWWEEKDGVKVVSLPGYLVRRAATCGTGKLTDGLQIQPGNLEVASVASSVQNGQLVSHHIYLVTSFSMSRALC